MARPLPIDGKNENVPRRTYDPSYFPKEKAKSQTLKSEFADSLHWDKLAAKYLKAYNLPKWDVPATPEALSLWIERMDLPEKAFLAIGFRSLKDAIELNPTWPLRALVGLALEARADQ